MLYRCKNQECNWEGENPTTHILHDENFEHEYIYVCPKCKKQIILTDKEEDAVKIIF